MLTGDLLRKLWVAGIHDAEVLHSAFDAGGYDMVLSRADVTRHIQLKASRVGGRGRHQTISLRLAARPAGCVVWMVVTDALEIDHVLWLGGAPGTPLPLPANSKIARHTKANAQGLKTERPGLVRVPISAFERLPDTSALLQRLLGPF